MIKDAKDSILLTWSKSSSSLVLSTQLPNGSPFFNLCVYLIYTVLESQGSVQWLSHVWLCDPMDCSTPGCPVHHQLPELTQTHVHRVSDAIQPSHPLSYPSLPAFNLSQHQDLSQWESSLHHVAKVTFYKCKRGHTTSKLDALQWLLFLLRLHSQLFFSANSAALHGGVFASSDSSLPPISLCPKLLSCWFSGPHTNQFILASGPWYVFVFAFNCPPSQPFPIQPNLSNSLIYGDWLTWPLHRKVFCNHIVWIRLNHCPLGMFQYNTILSLYVLHFKRFICVLKSGRL